VEYLDKKISAKGQQKPNPVQAFAQSPVSLIKAGDGPNKGAGDDGISVVSATISKIMVP
jgi:hypothetical protein